MPKDQPILTEAEVLKLINVCSTSGKAGIRNAAMITLLGLEGFTLARVRNLHDIDPLNEKGFHPTTVKFLQQWVNLRDKLPDSWDAPYFCKISKGAKLPKIDPSYLHGAFNLLAKKAKIKKPVSPQALRRSVIRRGEMAKHYDVVKEIYLKGRP